MNFFRCFRVLLLLSAVVGGFSSRCVSAAGAAPPLLRLHWLGLSSLSADTNAAHFLAVWQLPQTTALLAQTLDKLSRWPGHGATNEAAARLRPLLDDLIASEFYLEADAPTNCELRIANCEFLLAVRLPPDRAHFWQTNLEAAAAAWKAAGTPHQIEFSRAGDWTLVGVNLDKPMAKTDFAAHLPRHTAAAHDWLEADLHPALLADAFSTFNFQLSTNHSPNSSLATDHSSLSHVHLTVTGRNGDLHTHATLDRDQPYSLDLPAWEIPTNLIRGSLTSFGAARGFGAWLAAQPLWQKTGLTPAPDQLAYWSRDGIPFQIYVAAPLPAASNQLAGLFPRLIQSGNPWLATNAQGSFAWSTVVAGILWNGANIVTPFVYGEEFNHRDFILAGLYPPQGDPPQPPPARILQAIHDRPNLLFAESEGTGSRVEAGFFVYQNFRIVFHKPQMPHAALGTQWLKKSEQSFGETFTTLSLAGPRRLEFERDSTVGLNAWELHLLADWLESPQFPRGLHTFLAPPDPQP